MSSFSTDPLSLFLALVLLVACTCEFKYRSIAAEVLILGRTIQTAVLIETLTALGAEVTWSSCVGVHDYVIIARHSLSSIEYLLDPGPCCRCVSRYYFMISIS